jgi:excisionase family DNA binding protein
MSYNENTRTAETRHRLHIREVKKMLMKKNNLAEFLQLSERTVERLMKKGMPFLKMPDGSVRFQPEDVVEWMRKNAEKTQAGSDSNN